MLNKDRSKKMRACAVAMMLVSSLVIPQTEVTPAGAATNVDELRSLIRSNLVANYDVAKNGEMDIRHEVWSNNEKDVLTVYAQNLKKNNSGAKFKLYDINADGTDELIFIDSKKTVGLYWYDSSEYKVNCAGMFAKTTEIYKNLKKKQLVLVQTPSKNKKTITTFKVSSYGDIKKASVYTKSGSKYKKGSKKTTKKVFNKTYKSVKKYSKLKLGSIPKEDCSYVLEDECFYGKDTYYRSVEDEVGIENLYMTKGDKDAAPQDKYIAYSYAYDSVGWREYTVEPELTRYVFGPDVVDKKTGKTYQQQDWEAMSKEVFSGQCAPPFLTETVDENGETILDIDADGEIQNVEVKSREIKHGTDTYNCKEYSLEYGDCTLRLSFFEEGAYKGRIAEAGIYYPHVTGEVAHDKWTFTYGEAVGNPAEHDPKIYDRITAYGEEPGTKARSVTIAAASEELKQTIKTNENVRFELYSGGSGEFYTTINDTDIVLPVKEEDMNSEEISKEIRTLLEAVSIEAEKALNPPNGQMTYADADESYTLLWREKTNK